MSVVADSGKWVNFCVKKAFLYGLILSVAGCNDEPELRSDSVAIVENSYIPEWRSHRVSRYEVIRELPHDSGAYTQGLMLLGDYWIESTGGYGASSIRWVNRETGEVVLKNDLPGDLFGEGVAGLDGRFYQLTWEGQKGFIYDAESLKKLGEFPYSGEGWGLTSDGKSLIMSDGSDRLRFLDPKTFRVQREVAVRIEGRPVERLNELEFIEGEIFANVWHTDQIVRINPDSGNVKGIIQLDNIYPGAGAPNPEFVLNGIAYDDAKKQLYVTGKCWPKIYQIRLIKEQ